VLSALVLLAVVVGVPVLLVRFVGWPLPTTLPDRSWLTAPIGAATLVKVFAGAVWLAWLHFTVCVAVEVRAELRSDGRLTHVPLGGGSQPVGAAPGGRRAAAAQQRTARAGCRCRRRHTGCPDVDRSRAVAGPDPQPGRRTGVGRPVQRAGRWHRARYRWPDATGASGSDGDPRCGRGHKLYEVKPPHGRHYECLWDIAETYLGSGFRYKELVALNTGRMQPDGRTLKNPDLIYPGWVLLLPADATGSGASSRRAHTRGRRAAGCRATGPHITGRHA
jgi:hypothetical protein